MAESPAQRTRQVLVRFTEEEFVWLEERRVRGRHRSVPALLHWLATRDVDPDEQRGATLQPAERRALVESVGSAGEHLAYLARLARGGLVKTLDPSRIEAAIDELGRARRAVERVIVRRRKPA